MRVCLSQQMRIADEISIKDYSIPGIVLMENAALGIANEIKKEINNGRLPIEGNAVIMCGTGNNGGDGFAVARHLRSIGWYTEVIICGDYNKIAGDALTNLRIIEKMEIPIKTFDEGYKGLLNNNIKRDLIIDAILGTGFKGELKTGIKLIIDRVNNDNAYVISIDIPTGLNSDTGFVNDSCIKANKTVTLGLPKIGLVINDGPIYCGELVIENLTIPNEVYDRIGINRYLTDEKLLRKYIIPRVNDSHKGAYGKVFVVAGSKGMAGAGLLASEAALRSGTGIVELAVPESLLNTISGKVPELITRGLLEDENVCVSFESSDNIIKDSAKASSMLIGPGLGVSDGVVHTLINIIKKFRNPIVIDADGLNALSKKPSILLEKEGEIVLTPHPGEMARLMGISIIDVQKDRIGNAEKLAKVFKVTVVLKGYRTIIATPWGETWINPTGNPGMATAGSGDVLSGIITSLIAQGFKTHHAAICGAYVHGYSGDRAMEKVGQWGMTATDIIRFIPHTIKDIGGI